MADYYYYKVLRKTIIQFLDRFNNIQIARYNSSGGFSKYVEVPIKFSPKEKFWFWLNERKDDEMLPIMSASMTGIAFASERATQRRQSVVASCLNANTRTINKFLNPTPYDLSFQIQIWAEYMTDIDQILEQILPWFQPHIFARVTVPEIGGAFDMKIIFESASPEFEAEYTDDARRVLRYVLDFRVQTYLFKPVESSGLIGEIFINYYTDAGAFRRGLEAEEIAKLSTRITEYEEDTRITDDGEIRVTDYPYAPSGETTRLIGVSAWGPDDSYKIYDYEVYQFGEKVGATIRYGEPPTSASAHPTFIVSGGQVGEL
jgi:hypothetical protein